MTTSNSQPGSLVARKTNHTADPARVLAIISQARQPAILESSLDGAAFGRYSLFACDPAREIVVPAADSTHALRQLADRVGPPSNQCPDPDAPPFQGGWIGYCTYETGANLESTARPTHHDPRIPPARFALYDAAALFDHARQAWWIVALDWPRRSINHRRPVGERMESLASMLRKAEEAAPDPAIEAPSSPVAMERCLSRAAYIDRISKIKDYITAGDVYQVNLSNRFRVRTDQTPLRTYQRLRRCSPSSHAAFLPWGRAAIISSSPELFLSLRGRRVVTRPIKGTKPRSDDAILDARNRCDLATDPKEIAELNMIVDLLRNDLGRVCEFSSVRVTESGAIERHPTVYHRVSTVEGRLRRGLTWYDLLKAAIPGGSVTGAPKIRAMQIINELEPIPRGVYCGAIGWIGLDGSMQLNVAIRTMLQADGVVDIHAGGAIVADSQPGAECDEVSSKAAAMLQAVGVTEPAFSPQPVLAAR